MTRTLVIAVLSAATLLDGPPTVTGRIVADDTGDPIPNARVRVVTAGQSIPFVVTDRDGRFTIAGSTTPITLTAVKSGYIRRQAIVRGDSAAIEVRLARAAVISGRVVDRAGEPIIDARVTVESRSRRASDLASRAITSTDDTGEFRVPGLAAGSFIVSTTTMSLSGKREVLGGVSVRYDSQMSKTYYPEADTDDGAEVVTLTAGEERANVDIVVPATQVGGVPFGFGGAARPTAHRASVDARGAIAGRIITSDGRPLTHAVVRLLGAFAPAPDQNTFSDGDGHYVFAGLAAGSYYIAASKSGYMPLKSYDSAWAGLPLMPMLGRGPAVTLDDAQARDDVDVTLARLGSVSGFVFDELGDPVEKAAIQLLRVRFERGRRRLVPEGTVRNTDDRGRYKIFDLAPGQYLVTASVGRIMTFGAEAVDLPGYATTYYPGTLDPGGAQFVAVATSQDLTGIDFSLIGTRTVTVSGTLVDAAGAPTRGGALQLRPLVGGFAAPVPMNARTPQDGRFEFANVPPGSYLIHADRGRQNGSTEGEFGSLPVTVGSEDVSGLKLQMSAGSDIAGHITFDTTDPDHRPDASRVEISPIAIDIDASPGTPAVADIARDWTFRMRGINGSRRLLAPRLPAGWSLEAVRVNGVDATDRAIPFGRRDQSLSDVEVVLTDRVAVVAGTVTDADGRPIPNVFVLAFAVDRDRRYPWSRFVQHTTSARDGTFAFSALPGGSYYVTAVDALPVDGDDSWQDAGLQESLVPTASLVTVNDGDTRTIALRISAP